MLPYFILILIFIIQRCLFSSNGKIVLGSEMVYRQKKQFLIIVCIELIIFAGLRTINVGADTFTYVKALNFYSRLPRENILMAQAEYPFYFEPGYFFMTKVCAYLGVTDTVFLIIIAAIIYIPLCIFIYKNTEQPLISVLTYFAFGCYAYSLGIFRQMIAVSIMLLGTKYIKENSIWKYCLCIVIAMMFHTTALVMLPLYWLCQWKKKIRISFVVFCEIVVFLFARAIIEIMILVLPKYASVIGSQYDVQDGSYLKLLLFNAIYIICYYLREKKLVKEDDSFNIAYNAMLGTIFLQILGYNLGLVGRIVPYYSVFLSVLIPKMLYGFKKNVIMLTIITVVALIGVFYITIVNEATLNPYLLR